MKNLLSATILMLGFGIYLLVARPAPNSGFLDGLHETIDRLSQDLPKASRSKAAPRIDAPQSRLEIDDLVCMVNRCSLDLTQSEMPTPQTEPDCGGWND